MRSESFGTVKITYFDKTAVWKALRKAAADLASAHPEVASIAVFGSLARDAAVPGSDVDLLVTLENSELPFVERAAEYRPRHFPVSIEVFAYTRDEIKQMLADDSFFVKRALGEAVSLFERAGGQ